MVEPLERFSISRSNVVTLTDGIRYMVRSGWCLVVFEGYSHNSSASSAIATLPIGARPIFDSAQGYAKIGSTPISVWVPSSGAIYMASGSGTVSGFVVFPVA